MMYNFVNYEKYRPDRCLSNILVINHSILSFKLTRIVNSKESFELFEEWTVLNGGVCQDEVYVVKDKRE